MAHQEDKVEGYTPRVSSDPVLLYHPFIAHDFAKPVGGIDMDKMIRIRFSKEIIEDFLMDGNEIQHTVVSKGIASDSKLVHVTYDVASRSVDFFFSTKNGDPINEGAPLYDIPIRHLEITTIPPRKCTRDKEECCREYP